MQVRCQNFSLFFLYFIPLNQNGEHATIEIADLPFHC